MRKIDTIIIHCAATPNDRNFRAEDIDAWHKERGFHRGDITLNPHLRSIGYHYVIDRGGFVESGRGVWEVGAHALGHNTTSIGICLIGTDEFTPNQWVSLKNIIAFLRTTVGDVVVKGHNELPGVTKECPGFSVSRWLKTWGL